MIGSVLLFAAALLIMSTGLEVTQQNVYAGIVLFWFGFGILLCCITLLEKEGETDDAHKD